MHTDRIWDYDVSNAWSIAPEGAEIQGARKVVVDKALAMTRHAHHFDKLLLFLKDNKWPISDHLRSFWMSFLSKMTNNFKILAKALVVDYTVGCTSKCCIEPGITS